MRLNQEYLCTSPHPFFTVGRIYCTDYEGHLIDDDDDVRKHLTAIAHGDKFQEVDTEAKFPIDPKIANNPKAPLGNAKPPLHLLSPFGMVHEADAMRDGAEKYGAWNFREVDISASVYVAACKRHLDLWFDGEDYAHDSGVHHLGHAKACLALILDSEENGNLVDDRPTMGKKLSALYKRIMSR